MTIEITVVTIVKNNIIQYVQFIHRGPCMSFVWDHKLIYWFREKTHHRLSKRFMLRFLLDYDLVSSN